MKAVPLAEVCRIVNGGTPKSGIADYWEGDVAWLTPAEMGKLKSPYIGQTTRTITQAGLKNSSARQVPIGAVIMSTRAPIGHLAVPEVPMAFNQGCRGLVPNERLDTKYLYYFLFYSREALNGLGTGATFKELASSALGKFHIPLPPLEEQRRIVAVLDEAIAAIATATANAQKNLANARELFRRTIDKHFTNEGWPKRQLNKLTSAFDDGDWIESKDQSPSGIRLIQTGNVGNGVFKDRAEKARYISEATFKRLRCTEIFEGDCLVSRLPDPVGRACLIPDCGERMITAVDCTIVRFGPDTLLPDLFCYYSQSSEYAAQVAKLTTGATRLRISRSNLGTIAIPVPPDEDQSTLLVQLDELAALVYSFEEAQRHKLSALGRLKQSLLHRAFTGDVTAATPETIAA